MFRKYVYGCILIASQMAHAEELTSYKAMEESLTEGKLITIIYKNTQCEMNNPNPVAISIGTGIFKPQTVFISDEGYIAARGTWFSTKAPSKSGNGVNQHYSLMINNQNQMKVTYEFFNADDGQKTDMKNITLTCDLGKGFRVFN